MQITPIGFVRSPFLEKFATPRQPGLVSAASGEVVLHGEFAHPDCCRGLDEFSHLWLLFQFHQTIAGGWTPLVRPPRLGGNQKVGVFASRSTFRPNNLGMSVVKFEGICYQSKQTHIQVSGLDLIDGTPIIDIKPYLPYVDSQPDARAGYAPAAPEAVTVSFSNKAQTQLAALAEPQPNLAELIQQTLAHDPRPAYQRQAGRTYGVKLAGFNVQFVSQAEGFVVLGIEPLSRAC